LAPHVRVWDSVSLNTLHVLGTGFFDRALVCLAFSKSNGGNTLCVVDDSNDHVLSVWDWQKEERLAEAKVSANYGTGAHEGSIFAVCMLRNGTLVSGGKDRRLISWDSSYHQIQTVEVLEFFGPIRTIAEGRGETVLIGTTKNFVLQGSVDEALVPITQDTAQSAGFHPSGAVVAVGTQTGRWLVLDTDSKDLVTVHTDGNEQLSVMRYGPGVLVTPDRVLSLGVSLLYL
ncbi:hypothetical protein GOODEAATRI_028937, partial [Goodea atripinnis]